MDVGGVALKDAKLVVPPHTSIDGGWLCYLRRSTLLSALGGFLLPTLLS